MNWLYEPRGKYPDYDDEGSEYSSSTEWYETLLVIPALPLIVLLAGIVGLLIALSGFYFIARETYERGESPFPTLTTAGIILAGLLFFVHVGFGFHFSPHSLISLYSGLFIFYFTLAPLAGLFIHFLHLLRRPDTQGESHE